MVRRFFLAWCVLTSCIVSGQPTYVLQGQTFQLRPDITRQPDEILWKHNGNKVVEFNGKEEDVYGQYQHRVTLDWVTAELDIIDVRSEDSGEYELEAYRENLLYNFHYELQVIGRVAKPTISCNMSSGSSNTHGTQATLTCSAEPTHPQSVLKYEWQSRGNVLLGPKLTINLEDEDADQIHTCVVSNPLTNEKATFTSKSCYSDSPVALVASLVTIFIVLICVALAIVFCKLKRKACFAKQNKDEEQRSPAESKHLLDQASTLPSHQRLDRFQGDGNMEAGVTSHNKDKDNGHRHGEDHDTDLQDEKPKKGHVKGLIDIFSPKSNGQSSPPDTQRDHNTDLQDEKPKKDLEKNTDQDLEQPESEKKEDENEEAESPPANGNSPPTADKCPPLTQSSPDMRTREGANSDQVNEETSEENVRESHSTGSVKKQTSSRGSETALHAQDPNLSQVEMHTSKDDQRELDKTLSKDESESDLKSNLKLEEMESDEEDLYLDTSQPPHQSPTQTEPDDSESDDSEECLNTEAHADPEQEPETMRRPKSEESEEQSACGTADSEEGEGEGEGTPEENKKDQCGPKEEKTDSLNVSEDKEREMKTENDNKKKNDVKVGIEEEPQADIQMKKGGTRLTEN
ncbi:claspin-like isoform X13 [Solea solea]|uniref:claspin-like isoform X13 n=1 Tax=Solea solea TaxID=90069 RepID=UPI00272BA992|nr:claspin-like isoform X13 [Solea solea]